MLGGCLQKWLKFEGVSEIIPILNFVECLECNKYICEFPR
jgi:hypothetical protein